MNETQEILLDALSELRKFEAADEDDKQADADAIEAVFDCVAKLQAIGYRKGADGAYHRR